MITAILLSAGESIRFGSPKALAHLNNTTAIEHIQQKLLISCVDEIVIVLGAHQPRITPFILNHKKIKVVYNNDYKLGQISSIQCGLKACLNSDAVLIWPVDCPMILSSTVDLIAAAFQESHTQIIIPTHHGKRGHPPLLAKSLYQDILTIPTTQGLNILFKNHSNLLIEIEDQGIVESFNTPEELQNLKRLF